MGKSNILSKTLAIMACMLATLIYSVLYPVYGKDAVGVFSIKWQSTIYYCGLIVITLITVVAVVITKEYLGRRISFNVFRYSSETSACVTEVVILHCMIAAAAGIIWKGITGGNDIIGVALVTAVCEETVFRMCSILVLKDSFSDGQTVFISAVFFALAHIPAAVSSGTWYTGAAHIVLCFFFGYIFADAYCRYKNMFPLIIAHFAYNLCSLTVQAGSGVGLFALTLTETLLLGVLIAGRKYRSLKQKGGAGKHPANGYED